MIQSQVSREVRLELANKILLIKAKRISPLHNWLKAPVYPKPS